LAGGGEGGVLQQYREEVWRKWNPIRSNLGEGRGKKKDRSLMELLSGAGVHLKENDFSQVQEEGERTRPGLDYTCPTVRQKGVYIYLIRK